jgi:hypothetical protein
VSCRGQGRGVVRGRGALGLEVGVLLGEVGVLLVEVGVLLVEVGVLLVEVGVSCLVSRSPVRFVGVCAIC